MRRSTWKRKKELLHHIVLDNVIIFTGLESAQFINITNS